MSDGPNSLLNSPVAQRWICWLQAAADWTRRSVLAEPSVSGAGHNDPAVAGLTFTGRLYTLAGTWKS